MNAFKFLLTRFHFKILPSFPGPFNKIFLMLLLLAALRQPEWVI